MDANTSITILGSVFMLMLCIICSKLIDKGRK